MLGGTGEESKRWTAIRKTVLVAKIYRRDSNGSAGKPMYYMARPEIEKRSTGAQGAGNTPRGYERRVSMVSQRAAK